MGKLTGNVKVIIGFAVASVVLLLVTLGLTAYITSVIQAANPVSKVEVLSSTSSVCGTPNSCMNCVKTTYKDGSTSVQRFAKPAGTVCSDECVSDGKCTGYDPIDDKSREPYCNASTYASCRGSCTDYTDCILPEWMSGMTDAGFGICVSGSCLFSITFVNATGGNPPPTVLFPYETDNYLRFGEYAEVCRWIIQDGKNLSNSKNCLDYAVFGYNDIFDYYGCYYQYKCARPNFYGSVAPPYTVFNVSSVSITNQNEPVKKTLADSLSVPPEYEALFKNVKTITDITKAMSIASLRSSIKQV